MMNVGELVDKMRGNGIVGAGGAGFPSYAKLNTKADTIILNCAECEPLLKLHRQVLQKYAHEILSALNQIGKALEVNNIIIALKAHYAETVEAVSEEIKTFTNIEMKFLPEIYPAGDEVITIYETTGRVVPPGSIPIEIGVIVYNVETVLNIYKAINEDKPVTDKYITIAGEVNAPITVRLPLGMSFYDALELAGGVKITDPVFVSGGPMTGRIVSGYETITKTTNAILVFPKNHPVVLKKNTNVAINMKRAMAACCQCQMCTDLCPRNLLGHPIEPHSFMRTASSGVTNDIKPYIDTFFCSQCGLCEMYSCFQGLSPTKLIGACKNGLRSKGVPIPKGIEAEEVNPVRNYRRVSIKRLVARLSLTMYDLPAKLDESIIPTPEKVKILLSQHIGAPAVAMVKPGDTVCKGQLIGKTDSDKLGVDIHASINGTVTEVTDKYVLIKA